jgi:two-component system LytT family sensor kinase
MNENRPEAEGRDSGRRHWVKWATLLGFWTLFSLLYANQTYLEMLRDPRMHHSWWRILFWQLVVWYLWLGLTPIVFKLGSTCPLDGKRRLLSLLVHLPAAVVLGAAHIAGATLVRMTIEPFDVWSDHSPFLRQYGDGLSNYFLFDFLVYWSILGVSYAFDYHARYRERESRALQLESQLAQARLEALKMQIHPHFLFNTLHTIAGLVRANKPKPAVDMIAGLSDLLRRALDNAAEHEVALSEEIEFIGTYLDIQKVRFSDRLTVQMKIAPETLNARLPNLILQPLVENAIRHGISIADSAGHLTISANRENGNLLVSICDDGPGLQAGWRMEDCPGIGLANTRKRLEHLYGNNHQFELRNNEVGGVTASLTIPFKRGQE